jgi:hypothetical protein
MKKRGVLTLRVIEGGGTKLRQTAIDLGPPVPLREPPSRLNDVGRSYWFFRAAELERSVPLSAKNQRLFADLCHGYQRSAEIRAKLQLFYVRDSKLRRRGRLAEMNSAEERLWAEQGKLLDRMTGLRAPRTATASATTRPHINQ